MRVSLQKHDIITTCLYCKRPKLYSCLALSRRITKKMREAATNAPCFCCNNKKVEGS